MKVVRSLFRSVENGRVETHMCVACAERGSQGPPSSEWGCLTAGKRPAASLAVLIGHIRAHWL